MTTANFQESKTSPIKDSVNAYLKEIGRIPLLDGEQEIILAKQVQRMMSILDKKEQLEKETSVILDNQDWAKAVGMREKELKQVLAQGKRAKDQMIRSNLRLVVSIAKKYLNRNLELLDLIQEGSLGLERAVEKFEYSKGYKFSTYAYWWIRQAMTRAISNQARTIRLPIHVTEKLNKIKKAQRELALKLGRTATTAEVAQFMDITSDEVREYITRAREPISLDMTVGKEKDSELSGMIEDQSPSPLENITKDSLKEEVLKMLWELKPKEREVLWFRFGLEDGTEWTLQAIAIRLNLSRERVRQIESKALTKLKAKKPKALREYLAG
ncbi:MAG: RNA polymerase sigma factor, RpoD/SigA family [Xenococcaceae cyanobacterium MO_167.B52]|nr:RNA polymerase sigma factor, RpoD/SigA family [Xenococcaceae cyanobacterium MO_167.B52]